MPQSPPSDKAMERKVKRLVKRLARAKGNWPTESALPDLSPQMIEALLKHIREEGIANVWFRIVASAYLLVFYWLFFDSPQNLYANLLGTGILLGFFLWAALEPGKRYSVYALTQTEDVRVLPTLIKSTEKRWGTHPQVLQAICRLLEQVTEMDAGLLSQPIQNRLWDLALPPILLKCGYDETLAISALEAFVHIGSRETLVRMQRFSQENAPYPTHKRIVARIERLIPVMKARLQRQEVMQTLLRSSDAVVSEPDTLLRAAHPTRPEPTAQLLRVYPSETPADET